MRFSPDTIESILGKAEVYNTTKEGEDIYESTPYCLNIYYRFKDDKETKFRPLHSISPEDDVLEVSQSTSDQN